MLKKTYLLSQGFDTVGTELVRGCDNSVRRKSDVKPNKIGVKG